MIMDRNRVADHLRITEGVVVVEVIEDYSSSLLDVIAYVPGLPDEAEAIFSALRRPPGGKESLLSYPTHTHKLLPVSWFWQNYSSHIADCLYSSIHDGYNGMHEAVIAWAMAGAPPIGQLSYPVNVVRYKVNDDGYDTEATCKRVGGRRFPVVEVLPRYRPRGGTVIPSTGHINTSTLWRSKKAENSANSRWWV